MCQLVGLSFNYSCGKTKKSQDRESDIVQHGAIWLVITVTSMKKDLLPACNEAQTLPGSTI